MDEFICEACKKQFPLSDQGRDERLCIDCDHDRYYGFVESDYQIAEAEKNVLFGNPEFYMT